MNVSATNPMADLYRRLRAVGLTRPYVRKMILPDWWDDRVATIQPVTPKVLVFSPATWALISHLFATQPVLLHSGISASASSRDPKM